MHTARVVQREGACPERPRHRALGFRGRLLHAPGHPAPAFGGGRARRARAGGRASLLSMRVHVMTLRCFLQAFARTRFLVFVFCVCVCVGV